MDGNLRNKAELEVVDTAANYPTARHMKPAQQLRGIGLHPSFTCPQEAFLRAQFAFLILLVTLSSLALSAQSRMEAGLFVDYLDVSQTSTNNFGLGARFGYRIHHNVMLEGELAYDYGLNFDEAYRNIVNGNIVAIERTSVGVTHGLFGPMLQPAKGPFRPFVTFKAGFTDFRLSPGLLPESNIVSTILGIRTSNLNAAIYPGGGIEASIGPVGVRFELGDEIYFNNGGHNNLRITFGPIVRF
jgi:hypothetical protein